MGMPDTQEESVAARRRTGGGGRKTNKNDGIISRNSRRYSNESKTKNKQNNSVWPGIHTHT